MNNWAKIQRLLASLLRVFGWYVLAILITGALLNSLEFGSLYISGVIGAFFLWIVHWFGVAKGKRDSIRMITGIEEGNPENVDRLLRYLEDPARLRNDSQLQKATKEVISEIEKSQTAHEDKRLMD